MVLISLALQLFLLFAGNIRRRRRVGWLRFLVWLAYLAAYAVAVSTIGLFSQYENKYKLRSLESSEDLRSVTMPFLWAPFLLLHLGGPDTITAFSIEDNNLWTRQLINLALQLSLALYVFWKSFDLLNSELLAVAVPLFVSGIIKYGERICALKSGSRDSLDCRAKKGDLANLKVGTAVKPPPGDADSGEPPGGAVVERPPGKGDAMEPLPDASADVGPPPGEADSGEPPCGAVVEPPCPRGRAVERPPGKGDAMEPLPGASADVVPLPGDAVERDLVASCALSSMLSGRGLLVGRKVYHLGDKDWPEFQIGFEGPKDKLEFVLMEIGMIYDMLYTKAMVLQSWTGGVFRCIALVAMMVAFVLFWVYQHLYSQKTTNAAISYTLFVAAIFMEVYSIFMVIASPWTRARSKVLCWLSSKLAWWFPSQGLPSPFMGQYNLVEYSMSTKYRSEPISRLLETLGLEKHWRNFWYVNHIEDKDMVDYIVGLFNFEHNPCGERSHKLQLGEKLKDLLTLPFEHVLLCLHIFTQMHLSALPDDASQEMKALESQCKELSHYLMYLMAVHPSMLPVSNAAQDLLASFIEWVRKNSYKKNAAILRSYAFDVIEIEMGQRSPFIQTPSVESLRDMKELWARLLIYAAGKCPMELHARQLDSGVELLTVVGSLLIHCSIGDAGSRELELLAPPPGKTAQEMQVAIEVVALITIVKKDDNLYAFEFSEQTQDEQVLLHQRPAQSTSQPKPPQQKKKKQHPPLVQQKKKNQPPRLYVEAWAKDEHVPQQPPAPPAPQASIHGGTFLLEKFWGADVGPKQRPQFSDKW